MEEIKCRQYLQYCFIDENLDTPSNHKMVNFISRMFAVENVEKANFATFVPPCEM